ASFHLSENIAPLKSGTKQVGKGKFSCILSLDVSSLNITADEVRKALSIHEEIVHVSVEINTSSRLQAAV
ncbi:MAG: hypothetical protein PSV34_14590, partial [Acinetobacter sp.]|nr:hypothetical protein [Acinetobacter sp.]